MTKSRPLFLCTALVLAASLGTSACKTIQDVLESSKAKMPEAMGCPESEVSFEPFAGVSAIAKGCGKKQLILCFAGGQLLICGPTQDLWARASFDMACSKDQLELVPLDSDGHTVGVKGCDKQATYQYAQTSAMGMDWILASDGRSSTKP